METDPLSMDYRRWVKIKGLLSIIIMAGPEYVPSLLNHASLVVLGTYERPRPKAQHWKVKELWM